MKIDFQVLSDCLPKVSCFHPNLLLIRFTFKKLRWKIHFSYTKATSLVVFLDENDTIK